MDEAVEYARSLAKLMDIMKVNAPDAALKAELGRVRNHARSRALDLRLNDEGALVVDGHPTDSLIRDLRALSDAIREHKIGRISLLEGAELKELLHLAVMLCKAPPSSPDDPTIFDEARDLAMWSVLIRRPPRISSAAEQRPQVREYNLLSPNGIAAKAEEIVQQIMADVAAGDKAATFSSLSFLLEAERAAPDDLRASRWGYAFEKAATPVALALLADMLPDPAADGEMLRGIMKRAGDLGAEALINLLPAAASLTHRRVYFDAIVEVRKGVPLIIDLLSAPQWFVVRNAALLLGEMRAFEAEKSLGRLLTHHDERVRIAATSALAQLQTASARVLVQSGIHDISVEVRRRAVGAFTAGGSSASATPLLRALVVEKDADLELEILHALGRVASPHAVQKLIRLSSASGAVDKPVTFRVAAIEALAAARRVSAMPILQVLLGDSEPTVRSTARHLIQSVNAMAGAR